MRAEKPSIVVSFDERLCDLALPSSFSPRRPMQAYARDNEPCRRPVKYVTSMLYLFSCVD